MARSVQILMLYRHILRAAQRFPSIKREQVLAEIKQEFHKNKDLTDPSRVEKEIQLALRSLEQLEAYTGINRKESDWDVSLRGPI